MTECNQKISEFQGHFGRKVTADFSGGYLSIDGGALHPGHGCEARECFRDERFQPLVEHSVKEMLRQRIGALALGYEDNPLHALMAGKQDIEGGDWLCEEAKGKALAAHSTLNRLELGALDGDGRYKKILCRPEQIEAPLIEEGVKAVPRRSREIVLDFYATHDPLDGAGK